MFKEASVAGVKSTQRRDVECKETQATGTRYCEAIGLCSELVLVFYQFAVLQY